MHLESRVSSNLDLRIRDGNPILTLPGSSLDELLHCLQVYHWFSLARGRPRCLSTDPKLNFFSPSPEKGEQSAWGERCSDVQTWSLDFRFLLFFLSFPSFASVTC